MRVLRLEGIGSGGKWIGGWGGGLWGGRETRSSRDNSRLLFWLKTWTIPPLLLLRTLATSNGKTKERETTQINRMSKGTWQIRGRSPPKITFLRVGLESDTVSCPSRPLLLTPPPFSTCLWSATNSVVLSCDGTVPPIDVERRREKYFVALC